MTVLPRARPSERGVDPAALLALVEALDTSAHEPHSLMVLRHGAVVAEAWWAPFRPDLPHVLYSLSKSFTSMAVGLAVDEGLLDLDEPIVGILGDRGPRPPLDRMSRTTLRHALTMTTGHDSDPIVTLFPWIIENPDGDWLDGFFALEPEHEPGGPFTYNQLASFAAARAVEARTGRRVSDYLRDRLLEPLGAGDARWMERHGHDLGFAGLHLRTESIAAFGQLCLDRGRLGGRQLVPEAWIDAATSRQVPNDPANRGAGDRNPEPDWNAGYGYQFWRCRHGFRGDGALGQFCIVWPDEDVVIATTASAPDMQGLLDLLEHHLGGALDGAAPRDAARIEDELVERTRNLQLPPPPHDPDATPISGSFTRVGGDAAPSVDGVRVDPTGTGWRVELDRRDDRIVLPVEPGRWTDVSWPSTRGRLDLPAATAGGRSGRDDLRIEIALTTTPHRLLLDIDAASGHFTLNWSQFPLHGAEPCDLAVRP